ncbi:hypothetical protein Lal_00019933 [Lupinus albus]|nr:hypothetical protein Lal_00019933 [Lupinus albus]
MTTNLPECVNGVLKGSRALHITALVRATYHMLNSWFLHHRNEATIMIIYCKELTKAINENNRKVTCQLVRSFSRDSGVSEVEIASRDGSRHSRIYTSWAYDRIPMLAPRLHDNTTNLFPLVRSLSELHIPYMAGACVPLICFALVE